VCHFAGRRLDRNPESIPLGRRFVAEHLAAWGVVEGDTAFATLDAVLLVVSELVTNAVKFSSSSLDLKIAAHRHLIEVGVADDNPAPAERRSGGPEAVGGRGIALVERLSEQWGQSDDGTGKTVWARLAVPAGSALAVGCRVTA
jgi:anti-sigma regulatory factor (Ser/Thr protein kinase)